VTEGATPSTGEAELTVDDFKFDGPELGSDGATIERVDVNHFRVKLAGAPPPKDEWSNKLQFQIVRHARGNSLRLDVSFDGGKEHFFNVYPTSFSYDATNWTAVQWSGTSLEFPAFTEDAVFVGHMVPFTYAELERTLERWKQSPHVTVHTLGTSIGGRNLYRVEVTDAAGAVPRAERWVHYVAHQHPLEHGAQWRMVGMVDWLLGDEGAAYRRRSVSHFVLMMSPDAGPKGWYRVNAEGVDMNRSYRPTGADEAKQTREAFLVQKDLEGLMASDAPVTDVWSMHNSEQTVNVEIDPGPEVGTRAGDVQAFADALEANDDDGSPTQKFDPLVRRSRDDISWSTGPHAQFGVTAFLCEGGGRNPTKEDSIENGVRIMRSIAQYYP
jgi:hypothetical protein